MGREMVELGDLETGSYIVINEEPCMITKKSVASPGNEEPPEEKVYAEGLFDGQKRNFVMSSDTKMEVPIIERSSAQILAIIGNSAQLIDLSSYETFELNIPLELRGELEEGDEVEYVQSLGRKKIEKRKG